MARNARCIALALLLFAAPARAETGLFVYLGLTWTHSSDIRFQTPDSDLVFHDVSWSTRDFKWPVYYGIRLVHWFDGAPQAGVMVDFVHDKAYADGEVDVHVTGHRGKFAVDAQEPFDRTVNHFNMSHGTNLFTANVLWRPLCDAAPCVQRLQPHVGLGVGFQLPHVEGVFQGRQTADWELTAPVASLVAGLVGRVGERARPFAEYRLTRASFDVTLAGPAQLQTTLVTHHVDAGFGILLGN